jgi:16S rRNA (adenine1518-N6/adenine1519-N6)-dimethyltransferase
VPPGAFTPPPKVESAVIQLMRKEDYSLPCEFSSLQKVVRAAFGQRRKMLRNSLKALFSDETLLGAPLFKNRPEQITVEDFIAITLSFEAMTGLNSVDSDQ